jgi:hypothetical protein
MGAYLLYIESTQLFRSLTKGFHMSILGTRLTKPEINTPEGGHSKAASFGKMVSKLFVSRSAAIVWLTGLTALLAGFRLATNGEAEGEEMFRAWMTSWALIWFALAGVALRLLKPIYDFFVTDQIAQLDAYQLKQLRRIQPSFDQELRSLSLHQQMHDELAGTAAIAKT